MTTPEGFQPRILGFLCNWCSYAGADLAGVSRFQYPPTLRVIRVMCSGRVDPVLVLEAFEHGLDGVMVLGCHPGDCHYATGNYYAHNRMKALTRLMELAGINPGRLVLDWVSAGEGERFAVLVRDFTDRTQALGPLGFSEGLEAEEMQRRLTAANRVMAGERIRWLIGQQRALLERGNVYGERVTPELLEDLIETSLVEEYVRSRMLVLTAHQPMSVKEMGTVLGINPPRLLPHVVALEHAGLMSMVGVEGSSPKYRGG
jgi:coenzyme F420-reducing hydrogenase delta subunit